MKDAKKFIADLKVRGWVQRENRLHTPAEAKALNITNKPAKRKRGTAPKWSEKTDAFCMFVKQQLGVELVCEYRFNDARQWRFDYACESLMIAIEQEGGVWSGGRHVRGAGYIADMEKYNSACAAGWTLIRRTPNDMMTGGTLDLIRSAMDLFNEKKNRV